VAANVRLEKEPCHSRAEGSKHVDRRPLAGSNLRSLRAIELPYLHMPGPIFQADLRELAIVRIPLLIYPPGNWVMQPNLTSLSLDGPPLSQSGADLRHFARSSSMKRRTHLVVGRLDERGSMELMMAIGASVCFPSLLSLTLSSLALVGSHQNSVLPCLRSKVLRLRTSIPHPSAYSFTAISPSSPFSGPFLPRRGLFHSR
jgi:hypothetical protein